MTPCRCQDPARRLSVEEAASHPFLRLDNRPSSSMKPKTSRDPLVAPANRSSTSVARSGAREPAKATGPAPRPRATCEGKLASGGGSPPGTWKAPGADGSRRGGYSPAGSPVSASEAGASGSVSGGAGNSTMTASTAVVGADRSSLSSSLMDGASLSTLRADAVPTPAAIGVAAAAAAARVRRPPHCGPCHGSPAAPKVSAQPAVLVARAQSHPNVYRYEVVGAAVERGSVGQGPPGIAGKAREPAFKGAGMDGAVEASKAVRGGSSGLRDGADARALDGPGGDRWDGQPGSSSKPVSRASPAKGRRGPEPTRGSAKEPAARGDRADGISRPPRPPRCEASSASPSPPGDGVDRHRSSRGDRWDGRRADDACAPTNRDGFEPRESDGDGYRGGGVGTTTRGWRGGGVGSTHHEVSTPPRRVEGGSTDQYRHQYQHRGRSPRTDPPIGRHTIDPASSPDLGKASGTQGRRDEGPTGRAIDSTGARPPPSRPSVADNVGGRVGGTRRRPRPFSSDDAGVDRPAPRPPLPPQPPPHPGNQSSCPPDSRDLCELRRLRQEAGAKRRLHEQCLGSEASSAGDRSRVLVPLSTARVRAVSHRSGEKAAAVEVMPDGRASIFVGRRWVISSGRGKRVWWGTGAAEYGAQASRPSRDDAGHPLESLPEGLHPLYRSLAGIVDALRSKTPKVVVRREQGKSDAGGRTGSGCRGAGDPKRLLSCALMDNLPDPDFAATFRDGASLSLWNGKREVRLELPSGGVRRWRVGPGMEWPDLAPQGERRDTEGCEAYLRSARKGYCLCLKEEAAAYSRGASFPVEVVVRDAQPRKAGASGAARAQANDAPSSSGASRRRTGRGSASSPARGSASRSEGRTGDGRASLGPASSAGRPSDEDGEPRRTSRRKRYWWQGDDDSSMSDSSVEGRARRGTGLHHCVESSRRYPSGEHGDRARDARARDPGGGRSGGEAPVTPGYDPSVGVGTHHSHARTRESSRPSPGDGSREGRAARYPLPGGSGLRSSRERGVSRPVQAYPEPMEPGPPAVNTPSQPRTSERRSRATRDEYRTPTGSSRDARDVPKGPLRTPAPGRVSSEPEAGRGSAARETRSGSSRRGSDSTRAGSVGRPVRLDEAASIPGLGRAFRDSRGDLEVRDCWSPSDVLRRDGEVVAELDANRACGAGRAFSVSLEAWCSSTRGRPRSRGMVLVSDWVGTVYTRGRSPRRLLSHSMDRGDLRPCCLASRRNAASSVSWGRDGSIPWGLLLRTLFSRARCSDWPGALEHAAHVCAS